MITPSRDESCAYWVLDGGGCRCLVAAAAAAIESVAATSGLGGKAESGFFFLTWQQSVLLGSALRYVL